MSIKVLLGSLETIDILLFLTEGEFTLLSDIHSKFKNYSPQNIYRRLEKLAKNNIVIKQDLKSVGKKVTPGGPKIEYKLSSNGVKFRETLITKALQVLKPFIDKVSSEKLKEKEQTRIDGDIIKEFIMEFSEEVADSCEEKTLIKYQQILERLLKNYF